jgi:hypothetical protein
MTYINTRQSTYDIKVKEELGAMLLGREHELQELAQWTAANQHAWDEEYARTFTAEQRRKHAKSGAALSDGSYPILNQEDANNAAILAGKGKAAKSTVLAHIRKRVKALGLKMPPSVAAASS